MHDEDFILALLLYISRRCSTVYRYADDIEKEQGYRFTDIDLKYVNKYPPSHHLE